MADISGLPTGAATVPNGADVSQATVAAAIDSIKTAVTNIETEQRLWTPSVQTSAKYVSWSGVTENVADAQANLIAIRNMLASAKNDGKILRPPSITVPINAGWLLPSGGGYVWDCPAGFRLLVQENVPQGVLRPEDRNVLQNDVIMENVVVEFDIDSGTGNPYTGNGVYGKFNRSRLDGVRIENYWGDQAFVVALYDSVMNDPYGYTEDTSGGTGLIRWVGGADSIIYGASGKCGDDGLQFVPINGDGTGTMDNLSMIRCRYIGGSVDSHARAIVALLDDLTTVNMIDCGFIGCTGKGRNRAMVVAAEGAGAISGLRVEACALDNADDAGQPQAVYVYGNVIYSTFDYTIRNHNGSALSLRQAATSNRPARNTFEVVAATVAADATVPAVFIDDADFNHVTFRGTRPESAPGIEVQSSQHTRLSGLVLGLRNDSVPGVLVDAGCTHTVLSDLNLRRHDANGGVGIEVAGVAGDTLRVDSDVVIEDQLSITGTVGLNYQDIYSDGTTVVMPELPVYANDAAAGAGGLGAGALYRTSAGAVHQKL